MDTIKWFDYRKPYANCILAKILAWAFLLFPLPVRAQHDPRLLQIAAFPYQQVTGITVAPDGRIFVNFPYWSDQHSVSVAQPGKKSALTPHLDSSWNSEGRSLGFAPVDAGPLRSARYLEAIAHLNIQIAVGQGGGTDAAFVYDRGGR
jgi:hypothetical protein